MLQNKILLRLSFKTQLEDWAFVQPSGIKIIWINPCIMTIDNITLSICLVIYLSIYLFITDNVYLKQIFICFRKRVSQLLNHWKHQKKKFRTGKEYWDSKSTKHPKLRKSSLENDLANYMKELELTLGEGQLELELEL